MTEFPSRDIQSWHISAEEQTFELALDEQSQCDAMFDSVWCRRPTVSNSEEVNVHADDRDFIDRVYREYSLSTFYALRLGPFQRTSGAFWVNPYESIGHANSKLAQLLEARNCGLTIPETLVSNDLDRVQAFLSKHNHRLVCKTFIPHAWHSGTSSKLRAITSAFSNLNDIAPASIRVAPSIYQPLLEKQCEFRVLFLGAHHFALRMDTASDTRYERPYTVLDPSVTYSRSELPPVLLAQCKALMSRLNLVFAAFDIILTIDDQYVFLELNEAGQFVFMEELCPELPVVDAMCHFLIHRSLNSWNPKQVAVRFDSLKQDPTVRERKASLSRHQAQLALRRKQAALL